MSSALVGVDAIIGHRTHVLVDYDTENKRLTGIFLGGFDIWPFISSTDLFDIEQQVREKMNDG